MLTSSELIAAIKEYDKNADEALIKKAYLFAMEAHGTQKRVSGIPYFSHPVEVAAILVKMKLDVTSPFIQTSPNDKFNLIIFYE